MALLSRKGIENLLRRIMDTGSLTEDMVKDIERIKDDYNEREGILNKYGETYDGEDDEYEWQERKIEVNQADDWEKRYYDLKKDYIDRFWGGKEQIMSETVEDVKKDGEKLTYEDLFKKREGDK